MLRTVEQAGGVHTFLPLRNNLPPYRKQAGMTGKPATESTVVQGISFSQEVSFSDQNC